MSCGLARAAEAARKEASTKAPASTEAAQLGEDLDSERLLRKVLRYCAAGYLSKGYAQFRASPLADAAKAEVRAELRRLPGAPFPAADGAGGCGCSVGAVHGQVADRRIAGAAIGFSMS